MGQREAVRAVMILNEVEVDVARIVKFDEQFAMLSDKINEVKSIILNQTFPYYEDNKAQNQSPQNEGC